MLFKYVAKTPEGETRDGSVDAASLELAISSLQRRGLIITSLVPAEKAGAWYEKGLASFEKVKMRDIVILSRQLSTLFEAKVPIVEALRVLTAETSSSVLRKHLSEILSDIQGGLSISQALARHPDVFSSLYVNMVRSGEESGKLEEVFSYLADYLERSYELQAKARNAFIYPAFVLSAFIIVMVLMLVVVIPRLSSLLTETGQDIPLYTKVVIGMSEGLRSYGLYILLMVIVGIVLLWRYTKTASGKLALHRFIINIPVIGGLYRKIYLSRLADNMQTLLAGGVTVLRALEITADVVGNEIYGSIIRQTKEEVKGGASISQSLSKFEDIPPLMTQMIRIGEETGKLDYILKTMAGFYRREVDNAVNNLVSSIEPLMILVLGLGVGLLVAAVLIPIYNISTSL
ncbi:type II secretion system F family protein [Candidatus Giovannonibacteria bacterium]|nr:type II secretion system F family protein [Candidatus Giovannonibacteria bacterium]